jgi:hypothetical protein
MTGIILTLIAVLLVLCFAFYHADHSPGGKPKADSFFYIKPKGLKKDYNRPDR